MTGTRRYRFTLFWASVLVGLGVGVMALGVVTAGVILLLPGNIPFPTDAPRCWSRRWRRSPVSSWARRWS